MRFEPIAVHAELLALVRRFVSITGWKPWAKRLENFRRGSADNPLLSEYFAEHYPIELAMGQLHPRRVRGQKIKLPASHSETALLSFIAMVARVHQRLSSRGQARLAGMLRSGFDAETGQAPLEHEMGIAAHLMALGFDVTFSDMETGGGFDFLAERNGAVLEVECKSVSGDLGRKIHQRRLFQLGGRAYPLMKAALALRTGGQIARVVLPKRLSGTDQQLQAIGERLAKALETGESISGPDPCAIEYQWFSLAKSLFETTHPADIRREDARHYVERIVGRPLENMVMVFRPHSGVVIVAVESQQSDAVMNGLVRQLKDTVKDQFSKTRSGVICVKFLDISQQGLLEIVEQDKSDKPTTLKLATSYLLGREDWNLVHTLAFLTPGHSIASRVVDGQVVTRSIQEQGSTYSFRNPHNAMAQDSRFSIF